MRATSEGENEVNILASLCFKTEKRKRKTEKKRTAKRIN
jgi:hypothetical protein